MAQLLLQAIELNAVEGDRSDYENFKKTIAGIQSSLAQGRSPSNVLFATVTTVNALQDYNRRASHFIRATSVELQSIVGMLTEAMAQITSASQTSVTRLQDLQKQIEHGG